MRRWSKRGIAALGDRGGLKTPRSEQIIHLPKCADRIWQKYADPKSTAPASPKEEKRLCGLGLVRLARIIAERVEALADRLCDRIGGLISVALGKLVELVVSFTVLASGLYHLVVISIAGAVMTNSPLVLGISTYIGARRKAADFL